MIAHFGSLGRHDQGKIGSLIHCKCTIELALLCVAESVGENARTKAERAGYNHLLFPRQSVARRIGPDLVRWVP
jgi:hypothetical protein